MTHGDMNIFPCFGMWNSCPKFVGTFELHPVYICVRERACTSTCVSNTLFMYETWYQWRICPQHMTRIAARMKCKHKEYAWRHWQAHSMCCNTENLLQAYTCNWWETRCANKEDEVWDSVMWLMFHISQNLFHKHLVKTCKECDKV
jgi:hypothetical protein